jgi:high-affinity nickel-transport protein
LLGIAATQAAQGMSPWQTLAFPALFTAGMALVDTMDSGLMVGAYGWAFVNPIRKLWYNLTITAVSVVVAVLIGGIEALGLLADRLNLQGPFWIFIDGLNANFGSLGYLIIAIFVASWLVSLAIYRLGRFDRFDGAARTPAPQL